MRDAFPLERECHAGWFQSETTESVTVFSLNKGNTYEAREYIEKLKETA